MKQLLALMDEWAFVPEEDSMIRPHAEDESLLIITLWGEYCCPLRAAGFINACSFQLNNYSLVDFNHLPTIEDRQDDQWRVVLRFN